ncbi:hypothetical protein D1007_41285 [Hordeum vulgare]|nr:hypothetical protein D1007_41285 [Hordeum vulgare]
MDQIPAQPSLMDPMAVVGTERQFITKVDTHITKTDLSMVYTNDPVMVENSINTMELLLAEDDKYKMVDFDLEYTNGRARNDHKVVISQLCVHHHMLVCHYCLATRPCERFHGVWGDEKKKQKNSFVDLTVAIIDSYYRDMNDECEKDKSNWHKSWVNELDEEHIKYTARDAYTSYKMYTGIIDMRKYLLPADDEG